VNLDEAIRLRDSSRLPSRRDEDWRWTDLRGLLRTVPEPSQRLEPGELGVGPFDGLEGEAILVANGAGPEDLRIVADESRTVILRNVSRGDGAHASRLRIEVAAGGRLTLLESHEGGGAGLSLLGIDLSLGEGGWSCRTSTPNLWPWSSWTCACRPGPGLHRPS
jgi:Fe-S cluster assembly protein SufD